jgi:hypothetical protein
LVRHDLKNCCFDSKNVKLESFLSGRYCTFENTLNPNLQLKKGICVGSSNYLFFIIAEKGEQIMFPSVGLARGHSLSTRSLGLYG